MVVGAMQAAGDPRLRGDDGGEPVWVLPASDPLALPFLRCWIAAAEETHRDPAAIAIAHTKALEIGRWQAGLAPSAPAREGQDLVPPDRGVRIDPATSHIDSAGIFVDGQLVLATCLNTDDPAAHNEFAGYVAELLRGARS